jgi:DNA-binding NtrC family response regulator
LHLGYRVLEAQDGPSALSLLRERPEVELMLADVVLPGRMSGLALASEASARHPALKILFMSGYASGIVPGEHGRDQGIRLIKKPFRKDELAEIVRSTLDGAAAPRPTTPIGI